MHWATIVHKGLPSLGAATIAMCMTILGDAIAPIINSGWLVDLRTVCAVGGCVLAGTWWLAKKFQRIEDQLERAEEARSYMQKALSKLIEEHQKNHQ